MYSSTPGHKPVVNYWTQYFAQDKDENEKFKGLVRSQAGERYYPSFEVAKIVGLSSKAVSKLTSRVMAVDRDRSGKVNLGLSVKFEGKAQKVIDYSRKTDRYWEFSQATVDLIKEYKVAGADTLWAILLIPCL